MTLKSSGHAARWENAIQRDNPVVRLDERRNPPALKPPRAGLLTEIRADLRAHGGRWGAQGFWALAVYRFGRWRYGLRPVLLRKSMSAVYRVMFKLVQVATGIELPCEAIIGRNFVIDHQGGIIVSGYARIGDDCRIRDGVCIGLARVDEPCAPVVGNRVDIGSGAKLLGRITIGDDVLIGANAVVVKDVPANSSAAGVPAVVRPRLRRPPVRVP